MKQRKRYVMLAALFISLAAMPVISAIDQQIYFQLEHTEPEIPVFNISVGEDIHLDTSLPFCILYEELIKDTSDQDGIDAIDDKWLDALSQTPNLFPEIPDDDDPLNKLIHIFHDIAPEKLLSDIIALPPGWEFDIDIDVGSQQLYFGIKIKF